MTDPETVKLVRVVSDRWIKGEISAANAMPLITVVLRPGPAPFAEVEKAARFGGAQGSDTNPASE